MNYQLHYNRLIERARLRPRPEGYVEEHHVIPRCMGGSDDKDNLVFLTAGEHYVAHQLLVKVNPQNAGLIYSAVAMGLNPSNTVRNSKVYSWLRERFSKELSVSRKGSGNPMYGKPCAWMKNGSPPPMLGKKQSEKFNKWLKEYWTGRKHKPESIIKMRESALKRHSKGEA
jgi:hypothetical protein